MEDKLILKIQERKNKLLKDVEILDKMLESKDTSLFNKQYWDELVEQYDNPDSINDNIEDGLSDEEIKFLNEF